MGPALHHIFVGQGPRALPGGAAIIGRRAGGSPPYAFVN